MRACARPRSLAEFTAARGWLRRFAKIKALNRRGSSYGLKHCAEDDIGYVTNGCFIGAAIAEGFTVRCTDYGSPNAFFNISTEAWRHTERGREERRRLARVERWGKAGALDRGTVSKPTLRGLPIAMSTIGNHLR